MDRTGLAALLVALAIAAPDRPSSSTDAPASVARGPAAEGPAPLLEPREVLVARGAGAEFSPRVLALAGQRVRVRGWLVVFEEPGRSAFWLAPLRVFQDESGAGSGDLPPGSIRVAAPAEVLDALPAEAVPVEAAGRLEVGREVDGEGRPSLVRLVVEDPRDVALLRRPAR
jgi:hypothetical protein